MAASPQFAALPQTILKQISTLTVGLKTSPTTGTTLLITGTSAVGYSGTKITTIAVKAQATNLASTLLIFITDNGGTAASGLLFDEIAIPATTSSTTAASARTFSLYTDLQLMPGQAVYVSCTIATNTVPINVFVSAGDF
tara:strand:- start:59 stop:478 length:420 start_codon:yes stop_codon:yes gene_type:complete